MSWWVFITPTKTSRHDWEESYIKGLDLLGMKFEDRTTPWDGACGVFHPMLRKQWLGSSLKLLWKYFLQVGPWAKTTIIGELTDEKG